VALGLQQRSRAAVFGALIPIAVGHGLAIGRVGFWDLTGWSWIMASAHGAGVMLIPLLLGATCGQTLTGKGNLLFSSSPFAAGAVLVHTVSHLVVSGILAWLVYDCIRNAGSYRRLVACAKLRPPSRCARSALRSS
jgi:hypothetical protein